MFSFEELKRRKLVQWALAYLAGAWVVLQLLDVVAEPWGIGSGPLLAAQIALAFGFFATLVLAWYHSEQGRQRVSGPELLMLAALLMIAGAAIAFVRGDSGREIRTAEAGTGVETTEDGATTLLGLDSIPERSIAVLPLENLSPSEEHAWFAGAMTEQITSAISKVPDLRVTSRGSASKFPESGMTVREFATGELGVAHVLEGSVQRVEDQIQITVQLIDARTDVHLLSETYERELTDVLELQVEIARQVADRLASSFTERDWERILAGATHDPVAYDLYLRAQEIPDPGMTPEQLGEKTDLLRRAVRRDSTFGLAWAHLGLAYFEQARSDDDARADSSRAALGRAVDLTKGPLRAWARAVRALLFQRDPEEAIERLREAAAADPNHPGLVDALARVYEWNGDLPAAVRYRRRAAAVDPLNSFHWRALSSQYRRLGLFDQADEANRRAIELAPERTVPWMQRIVTELVQDRHGAALAAADSLETRGDPRASLWRGVVHVSADEVEKAQEALARTPGQALKDQPAFLPTVAHVRFLRGDTTGARRMLDQAEASLGSGTGVIRPQRDPFSALEIAAVRGDPGTAVGALRAYVDAGGRDVHQIQRSPLFVRVRDHPAFQAEVAELERLVERQRREVERDLAGGG